MSAQPEALRLADDVALNHKYCPIELLHEAAAELRRLHAENTSLRAALAQQAEPVTEDMKSAVEAGFALMREEA